MAIPNVMADLSTTAATNSPAGSESPSNGDDFLRAIQAIVRTTNAKGADIASATTTDIGAATGEFVDVTGTTTITGLGTIAAGIVRTVRFTGALTLTHNATSLILPSSANILTAANDRATFRSLGSGNWICILYQKASGRLLAGAYGSGLKGAAIASAATTFIFSALDGDLIHITGTTTITSFGTANAAGDRRTLIIDSAGLVITNTANIICPDGVNLTSVAGMVVTIVADTTTLHRIVSVVTPNIKPVFSAVAASNQSVTTGVETKVTLGTEIYDNNSNFASSRFTPTVAGYYQINGVLRGQATSLNNVTIFLYVNGVKFKQGGTLNIAAATVSEQVTVSDIIFLNGSTDYVELYGVVAGTTPIFQFVDSGTTSSMSGALVRAA